MKVFTSVKELRAELDRTEQSGIGFVPTMGALHAGHRSLVERARRENATVVVSVFVNPTQFNDKNDLRHYPCLLYTSCFRMARISSEKSRSGSQADSERTSA